MLPEVLKNLEEQQSNLDPTERVACLGRLRASTGIGVMLKTIYAVAVAAIVAAGFVAFPSLSFEVQASAAVVGAKGDRADIRPLGVDCSQSAWPYFEASCLRDVRHPLLEPRQARFIADK
ncbi:MAG: hypothetical protein WA199_25160 [Xanthobacteraceae bacterium]